MGTLQYMHNGRIIGFYQKNMVSSLFIHWKTPDSRVSNPIVVSTTLDMHRLAPAPGSHKSKRRIARGYGGKCGGTGGRGTRGQKSRSGGGVRPGFEGGQTPLYRRLPKLKGIAGGMSAGTPRYVIVNLNDLETTSAENEHVTLETLRNKKILSCTGK